MVSEDLEIFINDNEVLSSIYEEGTVFVIARHSYRELVSIMNSIYSYLRTSPDYDLVKSNISSYLIDDYANGIVVGLKDCSINSINEFKSKVCDPILVHMGHIDALQKQLILIIHLA